MGVSLIFKIAAVGILVTILSQILKHSGREEHAFLLSLAGLILVLTWVIPYITCFSSDRKEGTGNGYGKNRVTWDNRRPDRPAV